MVGSAMLVTLGSFALLILAYIFYGRFLAKRIFQLDQNRRTPAHTKNDGIDYLPTKVPVLFGHHFASIAGLGPILGPALAVVWGWVPAVLWVVIGCIFLGAVHDLGALTVSLRFKGRSIGDVCRELIGPRARLLFLIIIFFAMSLAMGAFVSAISNLFILHNPDAIIPSFGLMLVAMVVGIAVYKFNVSLAPATCIGLIAFAGLIAWGTFQPITTYDWFLQPETRTALNQLRTANSDGGEAVLQNPLGGKDALIQFKRLDDSVTIASSVGLLGTPFGQATPLATSSITPNRPPIAIYTDLKQTLPDDASHLGPVKTTWIWVLLVYGFAASVLPVWLLLQPRDYINSFQLYFALLFLVLGLCVATVFGQPEGTIHAQAVRVGGSDFSMPANTIMPMLPFLFVTIACGAVSGFHSLVSSGTTVRQMNKETDALPIGYGAMLTEGALAILVIMACVAGLGAAAWGSGGAYSRWVGAGGALNAVITGGANFLKQLGIDPKFGTTFLSVTIVAFAMTTLDSAVRLLRFNVEEIFKSIRADALANRYFASLVAVIGIAMFCLIPGSRTLWTLFGTTNQLLAGLTLLTVSMFLFKLNRPVVYTLVPMALMLTFTVTAMLMSMYQFWLQQQWHLLAVAAALLAISLWLMVEAGMSFARGRGGLEFEDDQTVEEGKELITAR